MHIVCTFLVALYDNLTIPLKTLMQILSHILVCVCVCAYVLHAPFFFCLSLIRSVLSNQDVGAGFVVKNLSGDRRHYKT